SCSVSSSPSSPLAENTGMRSDEGGSPTGTALPNELAPAVRIATCSELVVTAAAPPSAIAAPDSGSLTDVLVTVFDPLHVLAPGASERTSIALPLLAPVVT